MAHMYIYTYIHIYVYTYIYIIYVAQFFWCFFPNIHDLGSTTRDLGVAGSLVGSTALLAHHVRRKQPNRWVPGVGTVDHGPVGWLEKTGKPGRKWWNPRGGGWLGSWFGAMWCHVFFLSVFKAVIVVRCVYVSVCGLMLVDVSLVGCRCWQIVDLNMCTWDMVEGSRWSCRFSHNMRRGFGAAGGIEIRNVAFGCTYLWLE